VLETAATVYIVNQDQVTNSLCKQLLSSVGIFSVSFQSPQDLLNNIGNSSPACFLLSFALPEMSGLELMRQLRKQNAISPCIFSSPKTEHELIIKAMEAGSFGFIKRPFQAMDLIELVQKALTYDEKNNRYARIALTYKNNLETLTARENQVLGLILHDYSAMKISKELGYSHRTVENHRNKVLKKLGVPKTSELIRIATIYETVKYTGFVDL